MVDNVEITVKGGNGGDGAVSFRREKYIRMGGPDGGDGGRGGDVYLVASESMADLERFKGQHHFEADAGGRGSGQKKRGRDARDVFVEIPPGTRVAYVDENGRPVVVAEALRPGDKLMVARGGMGGKGNVHFTTPTHQAPERATAGKPGKAHRLLLEMRLLVDAAIIGPPNSGKSTLLGSISGARPKVAEYPFTTTEPILGMAEVGDERIVVAEMPAVVPGSSEGKGLGSKSVCHAERAKVLVLLLDGSSTAVKEDMEALDEELRRCGMGLEEKPRIVAVNKIDLPDVHARLRVMAKLLAGVTPSPLFISAATGEGVPQLMNKVLEAVMKPAAPAVETEAAVAVFRPRPEDKPRP